MNDKEREFWIERIEAYRNSGLPATQWCKEEGIAVHKLRYRITKQNSTKKKKISLLKLNGPL